MTARAKILEELRREPLTSHELAEVLHTKLWTIRGEVSRLKAIGTIESFRTVRHRCPQCGCLGHGKSELKHRLVKRKAA